MSDGKNDSSQALQIKRSKSSVVQYRHRPVEKLRSKCGENKVRVHRRYNYLLYEGFEINISYDEL